MDTSTIFFFLFCLLSVDWFSFGLNTPHSHQSQKAFMFVSPVWSFPSITLPVGFYTWVPQGNIILNNSTVDFQFGFFFPTVPICSHGTTQIWCRYFWYLHTMLPFYHSGVPPFEMGHHHVIGPLIGLLIILSASHCPLHSFYALSRMAFWELVRLFNCNGSLNLGIKTAGVGLGPCCYREMLPQPQQL